MVYTLFKPHSHSFEKNFKVGWSITFSKRFLNHLNPLTIKVKGLFF